MCKDQVEGQSSTTGVAQEKPWYHHWFGADYLELYEHRSSAEAARTIGWLLRELKLPPGSRVLDLACGSGRHGRELSRLGYPTVGLDLSWPLLTRNWVSQHTPGVQRLRGDMRTLPVKAGSFDLALSLFTSFGYFAIEADNQRVVNEASRALRKSGFYVLDFLNADRVRSSIIPDETRRLKDRKVTITRWVDVQQQRVEKKVTIQERDGTVRDYRESVRLYGLDELRQMMQKAGLTIRSVHGNYDGSNFNQESPRLILIGIKDA
ncbi:MAG: class I SAM-dependent methyltransferase [bacterium]|nr:class I SAM-dependent methyltransferase [bacterium]